MFQRWFLNSHHIFFIIDEQTKILEYAKYTLAYLNVSIKYMNSKYKLLK